MELELGIMPTKLQSLPHHTSVIHKYVETLVCRLKLIREPSNTSKVIAFEGKATVHENCFRHLGVPRVPAAPASSTLRLFANLRRRRLTEGRVSAGTHHTVPLHREAHSRVVPNAAVCPCDDRHRSLLLLHVMRHHKSRTPLPRQHTLAPFLGNFALDALLRRLHVIPKPARHEPLNNKPHRHRHGEVRTRHRDKTHSRNTRCAHGANFTLVTESHGNKQPCCCLLIYFLPFYFPLLLMNFTLPRCPLQAAKSSPPTEQKGNQRKKKNSKNK
ncbi:hypothetical protein TRSC58_00215 [Trypanosoma rangeli SC58]|uniref:Uncharacterized protein n=1 Tax=Trypanosoma rangeli SC58 TaxID=429131 RepID=A0A061JAU8_TRYRA|nr:hypothetical protein TRSC58_00215 [Trypanosoma rangeli SC58]